MNGIGKTWTLINVFLSYIVTAISLFDPMNARVVLFDLDLVYLKAV